MHGHKRTDSNNPLAKLAISLLVYYVCFFMAERYGNAAIAHLLKRTGIKSIPPYAAASLRLFGILLIILIIYFLIRQFHIFCRLLRSFWYGIAVGGYMFIYSVLGFVFLLPGAEAFQSRDTILFSVLYFILVGITEELVFRGITADLLLQFFIRRNPEKTTAPVIASVAFSGFIFSLAHAVNIRSADVFGVLIQMAGAFIMGMFLTAVYYRSGNIYAVMFLHIINDLAAAIPISILKSEAGVTDVISGYGIADLAVLLPYIPVLIFVLRPKKIMEMRTLFPVDIYTL